VECLHVLKNKVPLPLLLRERLLETLTRLMIVNAVFSWSVGTDVICVFGLTPISDDSKAVWRKSNQDNMPSGLFGHFFATLCSLNEFRLHQFPV
jgi:hypothetical protein